MIKRRMSGFTIVELLIVIVVIAVLAAITIVAFNGIQAKAENTKTTEAVRQYATALRSYQSSNGEFPLMSYNAFLYYCIAESGSCGAVASTGPASDCNNLGTVTTDNALNTPMKTVISKIPETSGQVLNCQTKSVRGAFYYTLGGGDKKAYIAYYLKGNQICPAPAASTSSKAYYSDGDITACTLALTPS